MKFDSVKRGKGKIDMIWNLRNFENPSRHSQPEELLTESPLTETEMWVIRHQREKPRQAEVTFNVDFNQTNGLLLIADDLKL